MAGNLKDLRKEAGFRSSRDFAEAMGINQTTYRRYEQQPDGIPLKQAWAIADRLGCSIDMVVGREPVSVEDMRGEVQRFYDGLGEDSRERFDDFVEYLTFRESREAQAREREERRRTESYLRFYERLFLVESQEDERTADIVTFGSPSEVRSAFEAFLRERERTRRVTFRGEGGEAVATLDEAVAGTGVEGRVLALLDPTARVVEEAVEANEGVIARIMAAYDEEHRGERGAARRTAVRD